MKPDASLSSQTLQIRRRVRGFTRLGRSLGASMALLGAACGSADDLPAAEPPAANRESSNPSSSPLPVASPAGQAATNPESIAAAATPLDDSSAAQAGTSGGGASADGGAPAPAPVDASGAATPDAGSPRSTDPALDENLAFILQDGFQTTWFVNECRSIAEDGTIVEAAANGGALPVGGGYVLECRLEQFPSRATTSLLSTLDEPWCALGELASYEPGGDERLTIRIVTPPDTAPAVLIATRDGERVDIVQAAAFGALVWPLWIEASYDVGELARAEQGKVCDETFGL